VFEYVSSCFRDGKTQFKALEKVWPKLIKASAASLQPLIDQLNRYSQQQQQQQAGVCQDTAAEVKLLHENSYDLFYGFQRFRSTAIITYAAEIRPAGCVAALHAVMCCYPC
jgi:hypothetical protein